MKKTHSHHIIPKHMGGSNDPSNLVELTIKDHANAHKLLYEKYGKLEDKLAWLMLEGRKTECDSIRIQLAKDGFQKFLQNTSKVDNWKNKIKSKRSHQIISESHKSAISKGIKLAHKEGRHSNPLKNQTLEQRQSHYKNVKDKLSLGRKNSTLWKKSVTSDEYKEKKSLLDPRRRPIIVDGVQYSGFNRAVKETGISKFKLRKMLFDQSNNFVKFL